jgi:hypothetical protein
MANTKHKDKYKCKRTPHDLSHQNTGPIALKG